MEYEKRRRLVVAGLNQGFFSGVWQEVPGLQGWRQQHYETRRGSSYGGGRLGCGTESSMKWVVLSQGLGKDLRTVSYPVWSVFMLIPVWQGCPGMKECGAKN